MHRMKKLYGEDAESFRPERWDPHLDSPVGLRKIGWGYLPFNGGPRVCLGRKYTSIGSFNTFMRSLCGADRYTRGICAARS